MNNEYKEPWRQFAYMAVRLYGDDDTKTYGSAYHKFVEEMQTEFDRESDANGTPRIDLQKIKYGFIAAWYKQLSKAGRLSVAAYERKHEEYMQAFYDEYYEAVFKVNS